MNVPILCPLRAWSSTCPLAPSIGNVEEAGVLPVAVLLLRRTLHANWSEHPGSPGTITIEASLIRGVHLGGWQVLVLREVGEVLCDILLRPLSVESHLLDSS